MFLPSMHPPMNTRESKPMSERKSRCFSPPWTVEQIEGGFKVVDANGQALAYCYARASPNGSTVANAMTWDEARRIAANITKLPQLLGARSNNE
jgi:hypothetical protein